MKESPKKALLYPCILLVLCAALGLAEFSGLGSAGNLPAAKAGGKPVAEHPKTAKESRPADRAAIRKVVTSFAKAFQSGDVEATVAHMTPGAEVVSDDGPPIRGRDAIRKLYAKTFADHPKRKITLESESLTFPSRDTAVAEGRMSVSIDGAAPETQRYSLMLVSEDGGWHLAIIRVWAGKDVELADLAWLVGTWRADRKDLEVVTTYQWLGNKAFIRGTIAVHREKNPVSGMQFWFLVEEVGQTIARKYRYHGQRPEIVEKETARHPDQRILQGASHL